MLTTREVIKTFYNALLQRLKKHRGDWNQNDPTADDYIKNRPFYAGEPVETVLVEESTVSFADTGYDFYVGEIQSIFKATVGETYKVSWDGTVYECTCVGFGRGLVIGNLSIPGAGSDTGEPFAIAIYNGEEIEILTADTSASHTFSISGFVQEVVKINEKYLPQNLATKSEVETVQSTADNAQTVANNAKTVANNAKTTANNAKTTANNAKITADAAKTTADAAKTTANAAKTTADAAKTTANNAKITADAAKTTADAAKTTADAANAKVAKALTVSPNGDIYVPVDAMNGGTYPKLHLMSKDQYHNSSFVVTESTGLLIQVYRDGGLQSNISNPSTVEFQASGSRCMRLKGIDELIMNSSTPGSTKEFKITVDDSGTLRAIEV